MLTFVIVGGGPTGVECAGALSELIHLVLVKDYPGLDLNSVSVHILEAGETILTGMPLELRQKATKILSKKAWMCALGLQ